MSNLVSKPHHRDLYYMNIPSNYNLSYFFENEASVKDLHKGSLFGSNLMYQELWKEGLKNENREK